jgi:hypothetical protein
MTTTIQNTNDLLNFLISRASSGDKNWFGFSEQRMTSITLAHEIAKIHADKMTPSEVVQYAIELNQAIYRLVIRPPQG